MFVVGSNTRRGIGCFSTKIPQTIDGQTIQFLIPTVVVIIVLVIGSKWDEKREEGLDLMIDTCIDR